MDRIEALIKEKMLSRSEGIIPSVLRYIKTHDFYLALAELHSLKAKLMYKERELALVAGFAHTKEKFWSDPKRFLEVHA